jgi:hypothetical protein
MAGSGARDARYETLRSMTDRTFMTDNEAARAELGKLIGRLEDPSFEVRVGSGWTVATSLCHLAFWDQRALFLLREWERRKSIQPIPPDSLSVESINYAVNAVAAEVAGPAAGRLAMRSAADVDGYLAGLGDGWVDQIVAAGLERYLRRSLHRNEHLRAIAGALEAVKTR